MRGDSIVQTTSRVRCTRESSMEAATCRGAAQQQAGKAAAPRARARARAAGAACPACPRTGRWRAPRTQAFPAAPPGAARRKCAPRRRARPAARPCAACRRSPCMHRRFVLLSSCPSRAVLVRARMRLPINIIQGGLHALCLCEACAAPETPCMAVSASHKVSSAHQKVRSALRGWV